MIQKTKHGIYTMFDGYSLNDRRKNWRYEYMSNVPIGVKIRPKDKVCECGNGLVILSYNYIDEGEKSQTMHGKKCPRCGINYFSGKTISLYPEAFSVQGESKNEPEQLVKRKNEIKYCGVKNDVYEYLFIDIEWNQKERTTDIFNREPIQIGLIGADENLVQLRIFSKNIRLENVHTLTRETSEIVQVNNKDVMLAKTATDVFNRASLLFPRFKYIVVWTKSTYELFLLMMKQNGIKIPRHKVVILQDVLNRITLPSGQSVGFETALIIADIPYERAKLHCSKYDVSYLYSLFEKVMSNYQNVTNDELCAVNKKTRVIHSLDCRYVKNTRYIEKMNGKILLFKGYRFCSCCANENMWRRMEWETVSKKKCNKYREKDFRKLPLTEMNINMICEQFGIQCSVGENIIYLKTNCGSWRVYISGNNVKKVYHGNYRMSRKEYGERKKFTGGFHEQKISKASFYDVVKYIYYHDRDFFRNTKKSRIDILLDKVLKNEEC